MLAVFYLTQYWLNRVTDDDKAFLSERMSSQLTNFVPVLDGSNYGLWSKAMKAFLQSQGLWGYAEGTFATPLATDVDARAAWDKANGMTIGNIVLRLSPALQQFAESYNDASDIWTQLQTRYGAASVPSIYKDFKEAISTRFPANQHPAPQFDKLAACFARLSSVTFGTGAKIQRLSIPNQIQALIAMAALPPKWEHLIPIICQGPDLEDLDMGDVRSTVIGQYENEVNRNWRGSGHQANKLSAVKRKRGDPRFNQQQGSSQQRQSDSNNQQQHRQRGFRGKGRGGKKDKGKGRAQQPGHSHIADVAALSAPTTHTVAHIGATTATKRVVTQAEPKQRVPGPYSSVNQALTLAERLEVTPTIQTVKTLEQRFADFDQQVTSKSTWNYDEEYDSEMDIDMSRPAPSRDLPQTVSDTENICGESDDLLSAFGDLIISTDDSDKENRAPTPEYVDPRGIETKENADTDCDWYDQLEKDPDARSVRDFWENIGPSLPRKSSNELIEVIYREHQEFLKRNGLTGLISPKPSKASTPGPSGAMQSEDEPLDWGTDDEKYASRFFTTHITDAQTVLDHPRRSIRDGSCNTGSGAVNKLYNVSFGTLDVLVCEHEFVFSQCEQCRDKMSTMWLLDSGASVHFTYDRSDFIEYTPTSDRQPVKTAANTIYIEGKGTVLLRHRLNNKLVTTRVHPVFYIPTMGTRLLSLGEFLQQGMRVIGSPRHITLIYKVQPVIQCKPLRPGQTLFWLEATSVAVEAQIAETPIIYKVNYDLMHRRLGHPSKDVMRHAKDHTKGFPDGIQIPTNSGICPGCAQGKMPAASHPPSATRATAPFKRIHSDLKSFPIPSYHKYKYFIVFLDDYTSYAWITLLRDKASAITALKQWLSLIKNQYGTTIKEWMSDAGGEYKSDAFVKLLKDAGIKVLQSAPHTPQQNGRAERFMRTIMDKAQAMRLEACVPQSWWEFAVLHALHCYNRTPMSRLKWQTPYQLLNNEVPDISYLRVFGCAAYVHIPEARRVNKLSPKSELMVYLGRQSGMKADVFMRTPNTLFYSDKALFDELLFPRCSSGEPKGIRRRTTLLDEPPSNQPPNDASEDTTPGDLDFTPPEPPKGGSAPQPDGVDEVPVDEPDEPQAPPPAPDPVPEPAPQPRRSGRVRKALNRPDNVYGDGSPSEISRDIERTRTWQRLVEDPPSSSRRRSSQDQPVPGDIPEQPDAGPPSTQSEHPHDSEDEVDQLVITRLAQEGGVKFLDYLLAKAISPADPESPDTSNIREWTFRDILKMPSDKQEEWRNACREELESLRKRKVFELVDPPKGRKVIKNRWVFDLKSDGRKKARLVAKGFSQVEGIDYDEIFSPVVRYETVRMMIALSALKDWHISGLDVKTAFLYGELEEELYMEQPEGFKIPGQQNKVMRLKRAIYGLKQAALAWWRALDKSMATLGCTRLLSDSGLFVNKEKNIVCVVYVDDVLFLGSNQTAINSLKQRFMNLWECRDLGNTQEFLRMRIIKSKGRILVDQVDYLQKVLQRFNLQNAKSVPTPLPEGYLPLPNKGTSDPDIRVSFQQVIGSLLYIMLGTRPDIAFAVTKLSQFAANPTEDHLNRALYICRYLLGTSKYALVYDGKSNGGLVAYADSDWASDPNTRKSTTGYLVKLANGVFSWNSRAQKSIALSSTEAEYMSLSDTSRQLVWIRTLFQELGINLGPIPLCGDNQGSIFLASNPVQEKRIKHIDLRYHYIREIIRQKQIELLFIEGAENPADLFTKNLGRIKFLKFREQLGLEFYSS
jgi:transposase InsO family protein